MISMFETFFMTDSNIRLNYRGHRLMTLWHVVATLDLVEPKALLDVARKYGTDISELIYSIKLFWIMLVPGKILIL